MITFIDPHIELFVNRLENSSTIRPVKVVSRSSLMFVSASEQKVVIDKLLCLFFCHVDVPVELSLQVSL